MSFVWFMHAGRRQLVIEVAPLDADSEEELEDVETPEHARQKRWGRVQQAAVKQCLRCAPRCRMPHPFACGPLLARSGPLFV